MFATIRADLIEGYGVEDIAVRHGLSIVSVRYMVSEMRKAGEFKRLWPA